MWPRSADRRGDVLERAAAGRPGPTPAAPRPAPTWDWITLLSRIVTRAPRGILSRASSIKASSVAAGDPHRHPGEPGRVERQVAEAVEQPVLAPRRVVAARQGVDRIGLGHEQILDRILVAAGAAQPDRVPDVGELGAALREQHRADDRRAVGVEARLAVGLDHRHVAAEPARMMAAAGEGPGRGDPVAARHRRAPRPDPAPRRGCRAARRKSPARPSGAR